MILVDTKKIIRGAQLINLVLKRYRLRIFWMVVLGLLAGFFGGLGVSVVIPLFAILTDQQEFSPNFISDAIRGTLAFVGIPLNAFVLIALIVVLFVLKALVQFFARYISEKTAAIYEADIRSKLFEHTMKMGWPHLLKYKSGYLERVLLYDVAQGGAVLSTTGGVALLVAGFAVYAVIAFSISTVITISTILFGIIIFFVLKPVLYRVRRLIRLMAENEKKVSHRINEGVVGSKSIKSYAVENNVADDAIQYFHKLKWARISVSFARNAMSQFGEPAAIIFIGILFLATYQNASFDLASFVVVVYLIQKMFSSIQAAQGQLNSLNELVPYLKVTHDYYTSAMKNEENSRGGKKFALKNEFAFRDVAFSYNGATKVLAGITFGIQRNSSVGLIGPSGVGKTTIADLMMRLLQPQGGDITADGVNIEEISLAEWRKHVVYVSQDSFFLNDTVENNVRFFDATISDAAMHEAAKAANIYEVIMGLPQGFKTMMGERGTRLSVGQRQRIALARALARKPSILILDEATSALDNDSEQAIQDTMNTLKGQITMVTIAHRISTLMDCDALLIFEAGMIIEQGEPYALLKKKDSRFNRLYHLRG